jgi:nitrate reductase delta subunit
MSRADHRPVWQAQSLLLGYPDESLDKQLPLLRSIAERAAPAAGRPLLSFLDWAAATPLSVRCTEYVSTFDHRRRCCLYLTYYTHGDTRKRGMALLRLKQAYAASGMHLVDGELPDHLGVVLEYASSVDSGGAELLSEHRVGIELIRAALDDARSPWAPVLASVSATLPTLRGDQHAAVSRLAAQGPPDEQVGLAPFGPPEFMPQGALR